MATDLLKFCIHDHDNQLIFLMQASFYSKMKRGQLKQINIHKSFFAIFSSSYFSSYEFCHIIFIAFEERNPNFVCLACRKKLEILWCPGFRLAAAVAFKKRFFLCLSITSKIDILSGHVSRKN